VVQDDLKRMIACHERLGKALSFAMRHAGYLDSGVRVIPDVVLTEDQWGSLNRTYMECIGGSK
jgi:hypothetical protein